MLTTARIHRMACYAQIIALACLVFVNGALAAAEIDPVELEKQLQVLEAEIGKFKEALERTRGEKSELENNLESNEKNINELLKKIQSIETDTRKGEEKLSQLINQREELLEAKTEQQEYVKRQIQAAYRIGRQEYLKVLLNQEDPNEISRMLTYYDYFNRARAAQINRYSATIEQLRAIENLISRENETLEEQRLQLQAERSGVMVAQQQKVIILAALNKQISSTEGALTKRNEDRAQLEALIERIQAGAAKLPGASDVIPFEQLKGQLYLPAAGKIAHRYGHQRNAGKLKWNGVLIDAPEGTPVHAVHYGRVVFSDWLRGFGLLLIINHGEGYMSLYGHNQVLYRETGDWVTAGETIATVGDSGGQNNPGLYFEIRVAGKTADPQLWCQARTSRPA